MLPANCLMLAVAMVCSSRSFSASTEAPRALEPDASPLDPAGPCFDLITTGTLIDDPSERARYGLIVALDVLEHLEHPPRQRRLTSLDPMWRPVKGVTDVTADKNPAQR
jgi:hypothetical protein